MGLLFHSICRPASYRPQLHICEPVTVTLHTSLQPASSTLPFNSSQRLFVFRHTKTKQTTDLRLQRSMADAFVNSLPYLLAETIILPTPGAATVIFILNRAELEGLALKNVLWNDFGSISEPNNNFMAGQSQSNYIWPQADTSISTQDTSLK